VVDSDHVELFVESVPTHEGRVATWLSERGLAPEPMRDGVLATGSADRVTAAFGAAPGDRRAARALPVPAELADDVTSVTVVPIPEFGA
jgi:hypothetical protein